jgi:hypothetical protein
VNPYNPYLNEVSLLDLAAVEIMATFMQGALLPPGFDATEQLDFTAQRAYEAAAALLKARPA